MTARTRANTKVAAPVDLAAQLDAAAAHYAAGRLDEAARAYGLVESTAPGDVRAAYSLAIIDLRRGRLNEAVRRFQRVVKVDPGFAAAQHNLGYARQRLGQWAGAAAAYRSAVEADPAAATSRLNLAIALAALGRLDEAAAQYRRLADDRAHRADALARLAILAPADITLEEGEALLRLARAPEVDEDARIALLFALGGVLDVRGDVDGAFDAYDAGNRLKNQSLARAGADPARVAEQNQQAARFVRERIDSAFIARHRSPGASKAAPIFIVGFPRCGSTLIEQVLASHAAVQGMGESPTLARTLDGRFPYATGPGDAGQFRDLAEAYLAAQRARGWDGRSRLVDKTLENYLHLGVIALMFPRATILHSVREPADAGFACFRQLFVAGNETLYDLAQIGEEYRRYRGIMTHWGAALPGRVTRVEHEPLVADPAGRIRWLVSEACGLTWDPACLRFDKLARGVTTASGAQVRRPIFATSVGRWRAYAERLAPLLDALGPYAPDMA